MRSIVKKEYEKECVGGSASERLRAGGCVIGSRVSFSFCVAALKGLCRRARGNNKDASSR